LTSDSTLSSTTSSSLSMLSASGSLIRATSMSLSCGRAKRGPAVATMLRESEEAKGSVSEEYAASAANAKLQRFSGKTRPLVLARPGRPLGPPGEDS
jgi:hypothetical protein